MRLLVTTSVGLGSGLFGFAAAFGLTGSPAAAGVAAVVVAGLVGFAFWRRPFVALDEGAASREWKLVSGAATLVAFVLLVRLTVYMVDPSKVGFSTLPSNDWEVRHNCLTSYYVAARAASASPAVYDDALYTQPGDATAPRKPLRLGTFNIDVYEYPPPFLLLPRVLEPLAPDFPRFRALWFGMNGGVILLALLMTARLMGPAAGTRALLLSPLLWAAFGTASTLQKGNVQLTVIALAMLAMALFERRRWAAGGLLLAFATASKLYPGMLLVYLLVKRRWHALGWTAGFGALLLALSLADTGWQLYASFLQHLPGLLGGEAFPAFRNPEGIAVNLSIPGLVFKAKLFGVPGMGFPASKLLGWLYTLVALGGTIALARRTARDGEAPQAWLAVLILATLRSPFLPQTYAVFPAMWLLTLVAATTSWPDARTLRFVLGAWLALSVFVPNGAGIDPHFTAVATLVPQAAMAALVLLVVRRRDAVPGQDPAPVPDPIVPDSAGSRLRPA